ncbi:nocobactin polyketide synthase NbtC [Nocardia thraciensis]
MLREEAAALLAFAVDHPDVPPQRIAEMIFRTRMSRRHRALLTVTGTEELAVALRAVAHGDAHPAVTRTDGPAAPRRVGFVFPGQGGQRPGMGRLYYEAVPAFREEVDRCDGLFTEFFGASPLKYLLDETVPADDDAHVVQPALFTQMVGLAAAWRSFGVSPAAVAGHSQGELAAAYVSGRMTLSDAVFVVGTRARAVDKISSDDYAMAVAAADRDACEDLLARHSGWAQVSVVNSPNMVGISGERNTVEALVDSFTERGIFARVIRVRYPAHTGMVNTFRDDIRDAVRDGLDNRYFLDGPIPCVGATLGGEITTDLPLDEYWFWNLRNPVRFDKAVAALSDLGIDTLIEIAEHPTLQLALQENLSAIGNPGRVLGTSTRTATDLGEFTHNLVAHAVNDLDYPWQRLRDPDGPVTLPLRDFPNVRMNNSPLWLPYDQSPRRSTDAPGDTSVGVAATAPVPTQLIVEGWDRLPRRSLTSPRALGIIDHTGAAAALATALCAEAESHGATARLVDTDSELGAVDTLVVLLPRRPETTGDGAVAEIAEFFGERRWWPGPAAGVRSCWLVTVGGESVTADDVAPDPVHAAIAAGFRCAGTEYLDIGFNHLDLEPDTADASAIMLALHTSGESELALRGGTLYAKRLGEADDTVRGRERPTPHHVVIIGGTGSLGLEICGHFADQGTTRITLVSRSGETPEITERLRPIRASGRADIRTLACDVADDAAVARLAHENRDTPADLIIHAAVDYASGFDSMLPDITADLVRGMFRGKITGIANVVDLLPRTDTCHIVLCSSLAASIGGPGRSIYAAANRMLDAYAQSQRAAGHDCVSVQWGHWAAFRSRSDNDTAQLAAAGNHPMSSADAIALGLNGLHRNAIVAACDWTRASWVLGAYGYGPVLSKLAGSPTPAQPADVVPEPVAPSSADPRNGVMSALAALLGMDAENLDTTRPLVALGLDSLQALEFRRRIDAEFGHDLPLADLLGGATVDDIVRRVGASSQPRQPATTPARAPANPPAVHRVPTSPKAATPPPTESTDIGERARSTAELAMPEDLRPEVLRSARADLDRFGMRAMLDTLDPVLRDGRFHTADEIAAGVRFAPRHHWLLRRWLNELAAHSCLDRDPVRGYRLARPAPAPERADLFQVCADLGYSREFATFLDSSIAKLPQLAQDTVRVQELLFPGGDMLTAEAAYRENLISRYLNLAAREAVAGIAARIRQDRSPVRILELGAGIGGTTDDVVAGLTGLPIDYHFTDLSTFFLEAARDRFAHLPWMRYGIVDMNADLARQPAHDIVIGANVLHNAQHIGTMLRQLHDLLRPGGAVVFVEACHANYPLLTSMKFLMSPAPGQPHPGRDDIRAGNKIFLTEDEWCDQLRAAGFTPLLVLPDRDHPMFMLDQRVFAAIRE